MMKRKISTLTMTGLLVYVVYSIVDRFFVAVPNVVAIPIIVIGLVMILFGSIKTPQANRK
ncbi:MAG: hypothetical protein WCS44_03620 [Bacillota bacterium]